jgi:hypothetical protein
VIRSASKIDAPADGRLPDPDGSGALRSEPVKSLSGQSVVNDAKQFRVKLNGDESPE